MRHPEQSHLLPLGVSQFLCKRLSCPVRCGASERSQTQSRCDRKALWARLRQRTSIEQGGSNLWARKSDLPHRPLPRQRNSPEHHGAALCQHHFRANLESQLHFKRSNHRLRNRRGRGTSWVLRKLRSPAGHGAKPSHPNVGHHSDGASRTVRS